MKKVLFILVVFLTAACEREARLASIEVTPDNIEACVGEHKKLQVSHTPAEAVAPNLFHYKTSDRSVASVNDDGVVTCHSVGTCTVTVATADKRFTTQCVLTVKKE